MQAVIIKSTGKHSLALDMQGNEYQCTIRGVLRLKGYDNTNPLAVGDIVEIEIMNDSEAAIVSVSPRKNYIIRKSTNLSRTAHIVAANVDMAVLVVTLIHPQTHLQFVDRFLATAEAYSIPAVLLYNKVDLYDEERMEEVQFLKKLYESLGYPGFIVSAKSPETLTDFMAFIKDKTIALSGNSGVGKSSILKAIEPGLELKIAEISAHHEQGKHSTTFAEMHRVKQGGFIIDTPGLRAFGTFDMKKEEIASYFPEILKIGMNCKYQNCSHLSEPGCAVIEAVDKHEIMSWRYESYCSIYEGDQGKYR